MKFATVANLLACSLTLPSVFAKEWPNYRGPGLDGTSPETLGGVKASQTWKAPTNLGFSSFSVANGKAVTLVQREIDGNPTEVCVALDAASGKEVWARELWLAGKWNGGGNSGARNNKGGDGPRSTPTVDGDKVYAIDAHLRVYCLDLAGGEVVWKRDLIKQHGGSNIKWQNAASPVIEGELLFVAGGGRGQALLALNKTTGEVVWKAEDDAMTHATPIVATIHGVRQVIFFTQKGLVALTTNGGDVLWRYDFPFKVSTAASPVVWEDIVYCSAGYGVGAGAVKISKSGGGLEASEIWRAENDNINHWSTPVVKDGFLYGMFGFKEYGRCPLACVDIRTGKRKWAEPGFGPGNVILAGGQLVALSDKGELVIAEANPDDYREKSRADLLDGKCWSTPALANGTVYIRSTMEGGAFRLGS